MKKTFIIVVICITTMVCMMSCSNNKPSEVTEKPVEEEVETVEKSEVGTYTFSDYLQKYELTLNNDGTAVLNATRMNLTDYGSWVTWGGTPYMCIVQVINSVYHYPMVLVNRHLRYI